VSAACSSHSGLPDVASPQYADLVRAFYVGVAGLQTGADDAARQNLTRAMQIAPGEPAAFADLGILSLRQQDFDSAFKNADQARTLLPDNSRIEQLLGTIESKRGKPPEAIAHFKKAVSLDGGNVKALYALAEETERQGEATSNADAGKLFAQVVTKRPSNVAAQLEVARLAGRTGDGAALKDVVGKLTGESAAWPEEAKKQITALQQSAGGNARAAALQAVFLRNTLARVGQYRQDLNDVKDPADLVGDPFTTLLRLPSPTSEPAVADLAVKFDAGTLPGAASAAGALWIGAIPLDDKAKPAIIRADAASVQIGDGAKLPFPGGKATSLGRNAILGADLNYDFKTDLIFAGAAGVRIFQQNDTAGFSDITPKAKIPANVANAAYTGASAFDVDLDGDLDIVLTADAGAPAVLRNNGDGTFGVLTPFDGVTGLKAFATTDIDADGDPDVALIDGAGKLHVFSNQRLGQYRARALPAALDGQFEAVIAADINADGAVDFVLLRSDGSIFRLSDKDGGSAWDFAEIARASSVHSPALIAADLDNNGKVDLLTGDGEVFLGGPKADGAKEFTRLSSTTGIISFAVADLNSDGRLDIVGLSPASAPAALLNHGTKNYHWQDIRVRATSTKGDQRINSFGVGGAIELRAGLLLQRQPLSSPVLHFGIGDHAQADVARVIWPNGVAQAEFELKTEGEILAVQRLKGSCPWLFAWDGNKMSFVKDGAPWSSALGLHINAQHVAGIQQTEEWFRIPGESLKPHDGYYDLRITAELWETYYIDHYSLMVVDHPEGTEVYTDERFAVPAPPLKVFTVGKPHSFASAHDDRGEDVSAVVKDLDRNFLDTFGRGPYQGLTRDHWVELELPQDAPTTGPLYLLASGWLHPTDATVNIAIGQNSIPQPQSLSLEVPDAHGNWKAVRKDLGFPAGKMKTVVLDMTAMFLSGAPRKVRVRTNLEIYWDKLEWATTVRDQNRIQHLDLASAELRYRGYSEVKQANPSSPELPDYDKIKQSGQIWRDLEGYTTRPGDVRELLAKIDGRMVIANAGDELRLRFNAPPPPPAGWKRDYVMVGAGWIKDGDFNTVYSKTVLPLPYPGMKDYTVAPSRLEDDPAYKLHPADWQNYHTRYVTPDNFNNALRN
jgi:Flp pilus assembly protein TadD